MTTVTNQEFAPKIDEQLKKIKVKYCSGCDKVKYLEKEFYRAGKSYQKLCIICHNKSRIRYPNLKKYVRKVTGFRKLPEETRNKIRYQVFIRINYRQIAREHKIKYQTLILWKRSGQIPEWEEGIKPTVTEETEDPEDAHSEEDFFVLEDEDLDFT